MAVTLAIVASPLAQTASADTTSVKTVRWTATPKAPLTATRYSFALSAPCPYGRAVTGATTDTGCGGVPFEVLCDYEGDTYHNDGSLATVTKLGEHSNDGELHVTFTATCPHHELLVSAMTEGAFDQSPGGSQAFWDLDWHASDSFINEDSSALALSHLTWDTTSTPTKFSAQIVRTQLTGYDSDSVVEQGDLQILAGGPCLTESCGWALQGGHATANGAVVPDPQLIAKGSKPKDTVSFDITVSGSTNQSYDYIRPVLLRGGGIAKVGDWADVESPVINDVEIGGDLVAAIEAAGGTLWLCTLMNTIPSTNLSPPSSENDLTKTCMGMAGAGRAIPAILAALVTAGGGIVVDVVLAHLGGSTKHKGALPVPEPGPPARPHPGPRRDLPVIPESKVNAIVEHWQAEMAGQQIGPKSVTTIDPNP